MELLHRISKRRFFAVMIVLAAFTLAACSGGSHGLYGNNGSNTGGSGGGSGKMTVTVTQPTQGTTVTLPFKVTVASSVPLGDPNSGKHHVHIWFDNNTNDYVMAFSTTATLTKAPTGSHVMHVSLRNADHSAAGADTQVTLMINAAGSGTPAPATTPAPGMTGSGGGNGY
jgi:hypothetical protein